MFHHILAGEAKCIREFYFYIFLLKQMWRLEQQNLNELTKFLEFG